MNKQDQDAREASIRKIAERENVSKEDTEKAIELSRSNPTLGAQELFALIKSGEVKPKEVKPTEANPNQ